jgi:glutamine synthetase
LKDALTELNSKALPLNLNKSVTLYEKNEFIKEILGEEIHYHFGAFYSFEFAEYMNQVDDWERNRYLYQI